MVQLPANFHRNPGIKSATSKLELELRGVHNVIGLMALTLSAMGLPLQLHFA